MREKQRLVKLIVKTRKDKDLSARCSCPQKAIKGTSMRSREEDKNMRKQGWGTFLVLCSAFIVAAGLWSSCSSGGGTTPASRIPINTATGWSDSPSISRDGQRLYFMYSRYDFGPWIISGGTTPPVLSGPDRPGLHHSVNPWDESDIYMATRNPDGTWSEAINLELNGAYGDASGMEIDGGDTFIWLQGNGAGNDIVMASKALDGAWNTPVDLGPGVNDGTSRRLQDNPHLSRTDWVSGSRPIAPAAGRGRRSLKRNRPRR